METLITFKTAKLAKEKKFNVECFNYYQDSHRAGVKNINSPLTNSLIDELHEDDKYCIIFYTAPSQSVLQKWLREEHNIHIWASCKTNDDGKTVFIPHGRTIPDTIKNKLVVDVIPYSTYINYEEAIEEALFEALNLI